MRILLPVIVAASGTAAWEFVVRHYEIPPYVLPAPSAILATLFSDWDVLLQSLLTTLLTTLEGFVAAAIGGIALALIFNLSKLVEASLFPYAVILQVTPVIAIAPLLLIYLPQQTAVIVCAGLWDSSPSCPMPRSASIRSTATSPACFSSTAPRAGRRCVT
jgi:NitT/TauT family transport system permease protein